MQTNSQRILNISLSYSSRRSTIRTQAMAKVHCLIKIHFLLTSLCGGASHIAKLKVKMCQLFANNNYQPSDSNVPPPQSMGEHGKSGGAGKGRRMVIDCFCLILQPQIKSKNHPN